MKPLEYRINLDFANASSDIFCNVRQGDNCSKIIAALREDGKAYNIEGDNLSVIFAALKSDNNALYDDCTVENNTIIYEFNNQTAPVSGTIPCQFILIDSEDGEAKRISTPIFFLEVSDNVDIDEENIVSSESYTALTDKIAQAQALINQIQHDLDTGAYKGDPGEDGTDGFSPIATVTKNGNTATISITDKNGTTTAQVTDGSKGDKGDKGDTPTAAELADDMYDELELDTYALLQDDGIESEYKKSVPQGQYYYTSDKKKMGIKISEASPSDAGLEVIETYSDTEIDAKIAAISSLSFEVVQTKPTQNIKTNVIYLIPKSESETGNIYEEWIYINNSWELIGTTNIDLSNYVTDADLSAALTNKETITNKITAITSANRSSTAQYTTPKAVADFVGQVYTPEQYGAKGDGVTDDKSAIEAMLADVPNNALCVFYGNYYISAGITITRPVNITMYGKIVVAPTADFCMRISGQNVRRNTFRLNLETTSTSGQWNGTYSTIGLDLYSTWENTFDVNVCNFNVGIRLISGNLDCTYNKLFIRYIFNCKTAILLTGDDTLSGGTTAQNTFIGGRIGASSDSLNYLDAADETDCYFPLNSELVGSRTNNNNNFVSVSFECGFAKDIEGKTNRAKINANYNYGTMIGCRFEGITSFYGSHYISLVGGYGFDNIPNKSGGYSAIGVNDVHVNGYTAPIKIARNGNSGNVIEVTNANGNKVWSLDSNGYSTNRAILLSPNEQTIIYPTSFMKLRGVSADNPTAALTALSNFEWGLSNYGFLVLKSSTGTGFVVQPIYTFAPSNPVTGTHALIDGKPMWFNGDEWVYANGDTAFSIPTKVSDLTNDAGYLTQHQDISGKVDKIEGKGLSTNDFTDNDKSKLDGIEAQANKTVVDSSLSASSTNPVQNKVIKAALDNIPQIPTDVSSFNNDAGYLTLSSLPIYNGGVQ